MNLHSESVFPILILPFLAADRWLAGISNSQEVEVAVAQNSPGEILRSLQSSSAVFEVAQFPAVPSEHQACFPCARALTKQRAASRGRRLILAVQSKRLSKGFECYFSLQPAWVFCWDLGPRIP